VNNPNFKEIFILIELKIFPPGLSGVEIFFVF